MMSGQKSCYELTIELQGHADSVPSEEEPMLVKSGAEGGHAASWSGGAEGGRAASCEEQQEDLCQYTTDTLTYIETVKGFCEGFYTWMDAREEELSQMGGIKGRAVKADLSLSHVMWLVVRALWVCMMTPFECLKAPREYRSALRKCKSALCECVKALCECVKPLCECMKALWECVKPLCECMKALCECVKPLCECMKALCECVKPLCECMKALCECVKPLCECMKALCECVKPLCECMKALCECVKPLCECVKALWECVKPLCECMKALWEEKHENTHTQESITKEHETPETKLADELKKTLGGLKELDRFLEAVEKLAVTSLHVFMEENQVLHPPERFSPKCVQAVIIAARQICPLLLEFKRDAGDFFLPKLHNVEVLSYQLEKYIKTTWKICVKLEKSLYVQIPTTETVVNLHVSEEGVQERLCDIKLLNEIRMGEHFRTVLLFKDESCSDFINKFNSCEPRMLESLKHLDDAADNLNYLNQVVKTFGVIGSLVGIGGGFLSICGLVLSPATERVPRTKSGAYLGIFCTVIIVLAFIIELNWEYKQKKASELFQSFMKDMQSLQLCPKEKTNHQLAQIQESCVVEESMVFSKVRTLVKSIDFVADIEGTSDIPYICQTAVKGHFNNLFLVGANVLSLATDVVFIIRHCCSLIKCSETEASEIITARAALWRSQMDSWRKIHDSLCKGQRTSDEHQAVLDKLFNQGGQ
ncbi:uncharacterized protein LOC119013298 isoform X3 [Acanthopagrus latus]|uniref:uncharacterized protein LOC119013298 isoform X3 n=1 Tax=Acanthopagrus latus TaxID=8177 RepID=UPI00187BE40E|nr:uncharacterized protein LOC119013298 isoform X3 [Acanthopagrus latus]